jgi:hypothetical protein
VRVAAITRAPAVTSAIASADRPIDNSHEASSAPVNYQTTVIYLLIHDLLVTVPDSLLLLMHALSAILGYNNTFVMGG